MRSRSIPSLGAAPHRGRTRPRRPVAPRAPRLMRPGASASRSTRPRARRAAAARSRPRPLHIAVRLRTSVDALWGVTQDRRLHPSWDHRFSRIEMLSSASRPGPRWPTRGRARHDHPRRGPVQAAPAAAPVDLRVLVRRPALADPARRRALALPRGRRRGGRVLDLVHLRGALGSPRAAAGWLVFRPFFQRETERSFRRLAARHFPEGASRVPARAGASRCLCPAPVRRRYQVHLAGSLRSGIGPGRDPALAALTENLVEPGLAEGRARGPSLAQPRNPLRRGSGCARSPRPPAAAPRRARASWSGTFIAILR